MSNCIYYSKEPKEMAYCDKFKKYLDYGCGECKEVTFADVVEGVSCERCIYKHVCNHTISMLGLGIVYECDVEISGCSVGKSGEE